MTVFRDVEDTCRLSVDRHNCAKCYVSDKTLFLKCREEFRKYFISHDFTAFFQDFKPRPRADEEFKAQKEDRMNVSSNFENFVNRYFTATEKLCNMPKKIKDEATVIMRNQVNDGKTPCQAVITAFEEIRQKYHFPYLYTKIEKW